MPFWLRNSRLLKLENQEPSIVSTGTVFLDRDGTVNRDLPGYIKSWSEFEFLPGSIEAVRDLTLNGFRVIIITNQSAVARNLLSLKELEYIHAMMRKALESKGGKITDVFYCSHMPDDNCACRKPKPGLIYRAQEKYRIDLASAVMVGDSARDIEGAFKNRQPQNSRRTSDRKRHHSRFCCRRSV
jgi:D-glycero-D-manno-heptose 1,7-bisphosphate phosphatase